MVSFDHLKSNFSRAQLLLYLKEKLLLMILRSLQYGAMFHDFLDLFMIDLRIIKLQQIVRKICNKIKVKSFTIILRIDSHFEVLNFFIENSIIIN